MCLPWQLEPKCPHGQSPAWLQGGWQGLCPAVSAWLHGVDSTPSSVDTISVPRWQGLRLWVGMKYMQPLSCVGCFWQELCDLVENIPTLKICSFICLSLKLSKSLRLGLLRRWGTNSFKSAQIWEFLLAVNEPGMTPVCFMPHVWPKLTFS